MLKEKIQYKEGMPLNCAIVEIEDYPIHFHDDLELVFVLDGSIRLKNGYYNYHLNKGDIFIMNDREIHSYEKTDVPNVVMLLQLDLTYFHQYFDIPKNNFFITDMDDREEECLERLRNLMAFIGVEVTLAEQGSTQRVLEIAHSLIDCLISDFQYYSIEDGRFVNESKSKGNKILAERVNRITGYMYENYTRRLTLTEIAEHEHLSIFYLSHVIKEATGLSFQELLNFIRVEESEKLLLGTKKKIGTISVESGFSAVRYYIKYFTKWFGIHPNAYRSAYTGHVRSRETAAVVQPVPPDKVDQLLQPYAGVALHEFLEGQPSTETVELNLLNHLKVQRNQPNPAILARLEEAALSPVTEPFHILFGLKERLVAETDHFVMTEASAIKGDGKRHWTILTYQYGQDFFGGDQTLKTARDYMTYIETVRDRLDLLLKLHGIAGEYRITRYRYPKEVFWGRYGNLFAEVPTNPREELYRRWIEQPQCSTDVQFASEGLFLQVQLHGFSAELILIDPVS